MTQLDLFEDIGEREEVLDVFCCQGGATKGWQNAGFKVTGVDKDPQPRYVGDTFFQADAIEFLWKNMEWIRATFVYVRASPPCQFYSATQVLQGNDHPDLIGPTREALQAIGLPFDIENVPDARSELRNPVTLCGQSFGLKTYRHRLFETGGWTMPQPDHAEHVAPLTKMGRPRKPGEMAHYVGNFSGVPEAREDMSMPWASRDGLRECIPPVYAQHVAEAWMAQR